MNKEYTICERYAYDTNTGEIVARFWSLRDCFGREIDTQQFALDCHNCFLAWQCFVQKTIKNHGMRIVSIGPMLGDVAMVAI